MLTKITSKNQVTLPKALMAQFPATDYFEIAAHNNSIVLTPVRVNRADSVRNKLSAMNISEQDVVAALSWTRHGVGNIHSDIRV